METRPLEAGDNRLAFSCGNESIDIYLREQALQDQERRFSVTYVATHEGEIVGYATSCVTVVEPDSLKKAVAKALPVRQLPALKLARIGVDVRFQGQSIGTRLLVNTMKLAAVQAKEVGGCVGLVVDAKPERVSWYEQRGFMTLNDEAGPGGSVPMFLSISEIESALV